MKSVSKLKKFKEWKEKWEKPDEMDWLSYLSFNCHPEDVLIVGKLFFPEFIERDGLIFLEIKFDEGIYSEWVARLGNDFISIQNVINHVHIYDLFAHCEDDVEDDVFIDICEMLKSTWEIRLKKLYPSISVCVESSFSDQDYGPTLKVYQRKRIE